MYLFNVTKVQLVLKAMQSECMLELAESGVLCVCVFDSVR